jgi:hypothetical protein
MDSSGTDAFWFLTQSPEDGPRGEEHRANVTLSDQQRQQAHGSLCPACQQQKPSPARAACGERRIADKCATSTAALGCFWTGGNGCALGERAREEKVDAGRRPRRARPAAFGDKWRVKQVRRRLTARLGDEDSSLGVP